MGLKIDRKSDTRVNKSILHRVADIPGGVTLKTANLGGAVLYEGTPVGPLGDGSGMYGVAKTAKVVTEANATATAYEVAKGHHFKVGDYFASGSAAGKQITAIDKTTNSDKDVITVAATLGAAVAVGDAAYQSAEGNTTLAVTPVAVVGSSLDVVASDNLFVDAWLIAAVKKDVAPVVSTAMATVLKGIHYLTV